MGYLFDKQSVRRIGKAVRWVEGVPNSRVGQFGEQFRSFQSVEAINLSAQTIPVGGVARIYTMSDGVFYCKIPQFPSIKSLGVAVSPIRSGESGSLVLSGIVSAVPFNSSWIASTPIGHRWNVYQDTYYVTPSSAAGPFMSVGRGDGFVLVRIDNGRNFGA